MYILDLNNATKKFYLLSTYMQNKYNDDKEWWCIYANWWWLMLKKCRFLMDNECLWWIIMIYGEHTPEY